MSTQDIPVFASSTACTIFDNSSELTLVSRFFPKKNNLPYEEATYTLAGVGGAVKPIMLAREEESTLSH